MSDITAPGGQAPCTLRQLFRCLSDTGRVMAVLLSTWNPELDVDGGTEELAMSLLAELSD